MVIRPMAAAYAMGEIGRPAGTSGATGGSASFSKVAKDTVSLHGAGGLKRAGGAGLYSASPLFKMIGAVELMSVDNEA